MTLITKPLLASTVEDFSTIKFPVCASPKLDGIRCLKIDGQIVSRNFKAIPNHFIRSVLEDVLVDGTDGEILIGKTFQACSSGVMSEDGEPDFVYHAFDLVTDSLSMSYKQRLDNLKSTYDNSSQYVKVVPTKVVDSLEELLKYEDEALKAGHEGVMIRKVDGPYKCGRSTLKEGTLLKLKRFTDDEALVVGFEELMHNINTKEKDEFGNSKRSSKKEGMVPANTLGALQVRKGDVEFNIGSGFDQVTRQEIWNNRASYLNKLVKFKHFEVGVKTAPRFPVFLGFRDAADL